jgi:hypothetical protein
MPLCKLCKKDRDLRESHFLPAAVYAQLRDGDQQPEPSFGHEPRFADYV